MKQNNKKKKKHFFFILFFSCLFSAFQFSKVNQALIIGSLNLCSRSKGADYLKCAINNPISGCQNNLTPILIGVCENFFSINGLTHEKVEIMRTDEVFMSCMIRGSKAHHRARGRTDGLRHRHRQAMLRCWCFN